MLGMIRNTIERNLFKMENSAVFLNRQHLLDKQKHKERPLTAFSISFVEIVHFLSTYAP